MSQSVDLEGATIIAAPSNMASEPSVETSTEDNNASHDEDSNDEGTVTITLGPPTPQVPRKNPVFLFPSFSLTQCISVPRPRFVITEDPTTGVGPYFADVAYGFIPRVGLTMVNNQKTRWYAVSKGWYIGVFSELSVFFFSFSRRAHCFPLFCSMKDTIASHGVSGAVHARYTYQEQAVQAFNNAQQITGALAVVNRF